MNEKERGIYAKDGKILTDGETYGKVVFLADGVKAESFHEITEEEYQEILDEELEKEKALRESYK